MAQLVKRRTLDFGSGHDLRVLRLTPELGSVLHMKPSWDSLSPLPSTLPLPSTASPHLLTPSFSLSLSLKKETKKRQ